MNGLPLILASASSRRAALLRLIGIRFTVIPPTREEHLPCKGEDAETYCIRAAESKAGNVIQRYPGRTVLAADTVVIHHNRILKKPSNRKEAKDMLEILSGEMHEVITALVLISNEDRSGTLCERTRVWFRNLDHSEIDWYLDTGESFDKAGAYGIQGKGSVLIHRIEGCFFNVVGLPVSRLWMLLKELSPEHLPEIESNGRKDNTISGY